METGAAATSRVLVGTSGWSYAHWRGLFYPRGLQPQAFLAFYAGEFPTVEINSSFYHLPSEKTVARWAEIAPDHFCFAVKANRHLTHRLRLRACNEPLRAFLRVVRGLGHKLGPVLFQLPPTLERDTGLLAEFVTLLPADLRTALEFRHPSWYHESVFELLSSRNIALCIHDFAGCKTPKQLTASFAYVRFHGPQQAYTGSYEQEHLARWAEVLRTWSTAGCDLYVYFNNDIGGYAVQNARELRALVARP